MLTACKIRIARRECHLRNRRQCQKGCRSARRTHRRILLCHPSQCRQGPLRLPFPIHVREEQEHVPRVGKLACDIAPPQLLLRRKARTSKSRDLHRDLQRIECRHPVRTHVLCAECPEPFDFVDAAAQLLCCMNRNGETFPPLSRHLYACEIERGEQDFIRTGRLHNA